MSTLDTLTTQEQQLKAQLEQINRDKEAAQQADYNEKLRQITVFENEAAGFRNQAAKAQTDADKQRLYRYAEMSDNDANALKIELGIVSEQQVQESTEQRIYAEKQRTQRKINALFIKSLLAFVTYLISDYASAQLELGFICFALKSVAQVAYCLSVAFGGCWLVGRLLFTYVSNYVFDSLRDDFNALAPTHKLLLLVALAAAILHFLAGIIPNAI